MGLRCVVKRRLPQAEQQGVDGRGIRTDEMLWCSTALVCINTAEGPGAEAPLLALGVSRSCAPALSLLKLAPLYRCSSPT